MTKNRCPEPSCSFFNQVLPHNAKICPMCGTSLAQAVQTPAVVASTYHARTSTPSRSERSGETPRRRKDGAYEFRRATTGFTGCGGDLRTRPLTESAPTQGNAHQDKPRLFKAGYCSPQHSSTINNQERPQLKLLHQSKNFVLHRESGVIGRQSLGSDIRPDIDLTGLPHAGIISRTHAHLYWDIDRKAYMIVDDSRNGSYLNDNLLHRGTPYLLSHSDKLQLGQDGLICLQIELMYASN